MGLSDDLKRTLLEKFINYCKNSTIHGVCYFQNVGRWSLYATWSIIFASSMSLCVFLSHMIWMKFITDPTVTVVETTHYLTAKLPFPAVAVCDSEVVYGPSTANITEILNLRGYSSEQIEEFYKSFTAIKNKNYVPEPYVKKMHALLGDLDFSLHLLMKELKKPCNIMMVECIWRSKAYNCSMMFREVFTYIGYCCQFDVPYFMKSVNNETYAVSGVQTSESLEIIINGQKVSPSGVISDSYVMLYVFDKEDSLTFLDNPIVVSPSAHFDAKVEVWAIDSSNDVKELPIHDRKCTLNTDTDIAATFYAGCISTLLLRKVVNQCRCLPMSYTANELHTPDVMSCPWERFNCVYQSIEQALREIHDIITQSSCYQKCDHVQYSTEVEYVKHTKPSTIKEKNYTSVVVHFSEYTCMKYRREVLYTWDQVLANLGGIFGLCLGGSVISVLELLWFLLDLLYSLLSGIFKRKITPKKKDQNKVFVVTKKNLEFKNGGKHEDHVGRYRFLN